MKNDTTIYEECLDPCTCGLNCKKHTEDPDQLHIYNFHILFGYFYTSKQV